ncbi:hypothetical protein ABFV57_32195, partial [Pseudomonas neuropathica]|uniref:hypothetical protein n=1 Tax=Pseudomonas neuropathica TaxID=2730425 RepID=UPI0034D6AB88
LLWLRSLGNKTFPHFEETRYFWPVSYGLATLAVSSIFVNNAVFDLNLDLHYISAFSVLIFIFLYLSYRSHERRRKRHLSRLKEHQIRQ